MLVLKGSKHLFLCILSQETISDLHMLLEKHVMTISTDPQYNSKKAGQEVCTPMYDSMHAQGQKSHVFFSKDVLLPDRFATDPILIAQQQEEQDFSRFEQAISTRWHSRTFPRLSEAPLVKQPCPTTAQADASIDFATRATGLRLSKKSQQRLMRVCLALLFLLSGFDLMGALVLWHHLH